MSRTERTRWWDDDPATAGRDNKPRCGCCGSGRGSYRWFANRRRRHDGKAVLRAAVRDAYADGAAERPTPHSV